MCCEIRGKKSKQFHGSDFHGGKSGRKVNLKLIFPGSYRASFQGKCNTSRIHISRSDTSIPDKFIYDINGRQYPIRFLTKGSN